MNGDYEEENSESDSPPWKMMKLTEDKHCKPFDTLEELYQAVYERPSWTLRTIELESRSRSVIKNAISDCHVEIDKYIPRIRIDCNFAPKTLICHDYKGGYLEDKHLDGINVGNCYSFYNWAHIDIFVYFSHHLVTIPPLCWINQAHKNGVKILGTFITENRNGSEIGVKIFKNEESVDLVAVNLATVMVSYGFDGWLLNIENPVTDSFLLKRFVATLTEEVHNCKPQALVIWYDSVTCTGELKWQNELNDLNRCFFDCCDGIFLNYVWSEEKIKKSVLSAKNRSSDVYVGIDVFGRNTFGGGNFDCYRAAQVIRKYNLSMALFAPGWTHETLQKVEDKSKNFENFINRDCAFWNSLWPYLFTHPIKNLFETNFSVGITTEKFQLESQEMQLSRIKFPTNLDLVPNVSKIPTLFNKCACLQCEFSNGEIKCLLSKNHLNKEISYVHRLFFCDIKIQDAGLVVYYALKKIPNKFGKIDLNIKIVHPNGAFSTIVCNGINRHPLAMDATLIELNPNSDPAMPDLLHLTGQNEEFYIYELPIMSCTILEIGCTLLDEDDPVVLDIFGIKLHPNEIEQD